MSVIRMRRGTTVQWTASTLILKTGEYGLDETTGEIRRGDGLHVWTALPAENTINKLATLKDVNLSSLTDGQVIQWNAGSGKFVNATLSITSITGTTASSFTIDQDGTDPIQIKNNSGKFELRNSDDSDYADLTVKNLTVTGATTTINSTTLTVDDNVIVLNNNVTGAPTVGGGIEVERGTSTNASIYWDESADVWKAGLAGTEKEIAFTDHLHDDKYISIVGTPTAGNFPTLSAGGELVNSAYGPSSFIQVPVGGTQGDILFRNATGWTRLPASTIDGNVLISHGDAADPSWGEIDGGTPA